MSGHLEQSHSPSKASIDGPFGRQDAERNVIGMLLELRIEIDWNSEKP
jgi:hypothetical protein